MCVSFNYRPKNDEKSINCQLINRRITYAVENNAGTWAVYQDAQSVREISLNDYLDNSSSRRCEAPEARVLIFRPAIFTCIKETIAESEVGQIVAILSYLLGWLSLTSKIWRTMMKSEH
jgi:hypothetical protein